jgi:GntR family transcriptional regulator/MocR family aminotransferase
MISVPIQIEHAGAIPVRAQISGAYAQAIRDGRLTPGAALPSVRGLSARLGVSPATIVAAYRELGTLGLVTASPRSAFRVAGGYPAPTQPRKEFQLNRIEPDLRIHPVAEFARLLAETAAADCSIGGYEDYRGHLALREAIAGLDREIGVAAEPGAGMLITSGAQQALTLLGRALGSGVSVAVEDPCYPGARMAFTNAGARLVPVRMTNDGPDPESLRAIAKPGAVAAFYCCPTYCNPTGRTWSEAARKRVLEAASEGGFLLIEDDYLGDLDYLGEAPPRLAALASHYPKAHVVRIRTFSKTLLPALRIANVSGDPMLIGRLLTLKVADDLGCSAFLQRTLARFISDGNYRRHLERVRPRYRQTREALRAAFGTIKGSIGFDDPPAGVCLLGRLGEDIDPGRFISECAQHGTLVSPGSDYWLRAEDGMREFRIGFASLAPDEAPTVAAVIEHAAEASRGFAGDRSLL